VFITSDRFRPSLIFVSKDGVNPNGTVNFYCYLDHKYKTRVKLPGSDKRTSLQYFNINYDCKKFYIMGAVLTPPPQHPLVFCNFFFETIKGGGKEDFVITKTLTSDQFDKTFNRCILHL
jgi:hypothetical protein